ncbi:MAG: hypothetical protein EGQ10_02030 [Clostridiales bacterium]|mgnify:FL=1|jgi:hypothetical protein|nr:hypothetical protein [Clostridiales bacterium]DAI61410.1 MAG TPA: hypothetical protein [Caudoviricetes sp.]
MADLEFNTASGQTVDRELLIAYLNTGTTSAPVWSPLGSRVTDSSMEYDWQEESNKDILGTTRSTMKKPIITQTFDPCDLDAGDAAVLKIWNLAVKEQNVAALTNQDMLIVHLYAGTKDTAAFAERYSACMVKPSSLGGEGGGFVGMPMDITYGGARTVGTAAVSAGTVTFTADT